MPVLWDNGEKTEKSQKNRPALLAIPKMWCIVCVLPKDGVVFQPTTTGFSETGVSKETRNNGYESPYEKKRSYHG